MKIIIQKYRREDILCWLLIVLGLGYALLAVLKAPLMVDETFHEAQIQSIVKGHYEHLPLVSTPHTYHVVIAWISELIHHKSINTFRVISFLGSCAAIFTFYLTSRKISRDDASIRTLQFAFFPLIVPFCPLLYCDVWTVGFFLLAIERALSQKTWQSALAMLCAVGLRPCYIPLGIIPWLLLVSSEFQSFQIQPDFLKKLIGKSLPFVLLILGFIVFVKWNHGVAMGDRWNQRAAINLTNVWLYLICFFFLFLPNCLSTLRTANLWSKNHILFKVTGIIIGFAVYYATYRITHPYNQGGVGGGFFLRNKFLYYTVNFSLLKSLTFFPAIVGGIVLFRTPLLLDVMKVVLPLVCLLAIIPFPLVEVRYYIAPFALFLLFRKDSRSTPSCVAMGLQVIVSLILISYMVRQISFP